MRIEQFAVSGYRHLSDIYTFGPGLNVVTGPNESGKSTLHEALTAALFGFSREQRRRAGGRSPKDLRRPWDGSPFGGVLTLVDREERLVHIRCDFESDRIEVTDAATGAVVVIEQPQQRTDYTLGTRLVGLTRDDFRQLSCLFQEGLHPVRPSETLRQSLQRAVEQTTGTEGGVEAADERLRVLLSDLGVHAGHYGPIATGRLARAEAAVRELESRLERAAGDRAGLEELTRRRVQLDTQVATAGERILDHQQAAMRANAQRLAADHALALNLARSAPAAGADAPNALPPGLDGRVAAARDDVLEAERSLTEADSAAVARADELAAARREARDAAAARDRLTAYADLDTADEEAVRAALTRLRSAAPAVAPPPPPPPRDPALARFRTEHARRANEPIPRAGDAARRSNALLALAAVLATTGLVGGALARPAALVLALVAAVVVIIALRHRVRSAPASPADFEGRPIDEVARAADDEDTAHLRHEAALAEHNRVHAEAAAAREDAEAALRGLIGGDDDAATPLETRAEDYLRQCAKHREYVAADRLAERAAAHARAAAAPAEAASDAERALRDAERELRRLLARGGVEEDDLAAALDEFDAMVAADRTRREEAEQRADALGRLEQLLDGRSVDDLATAAAEAARRLETHVAAHGERTAAPADGAPIEAQTTAREDLIEELADVRARMEEREGAMDDPADLALQLDAATSERDRILLYRDAARLARAELAEAARAAHRRVAPHLNTALARALPRITRGRYREAMVADDLSIRLVVPETTNIVDVEQLSRGTRDQVAIIQRLELARLLDPTGGGAPLLLDDCFAHTDEFRLPLAVDLLADVAGHRQVIVFTDDRDVIAAVRSADRAAVVIDLPDPVPALSLRAA